MSEKVYNSCVVGGGSAGVMSVLRICLNNDEVLFFPGNKKHKNRSRERWVKKIENMPGHLKYSRGIMEPNKESLEWLEESAFKDNLHWMKGLGVSSVRREESGLFIVVDDNEEEFKVRHLILCTGVMDVQPEIQESIKDILPFANKQTADYCLRCDGHHVLGKELAIIGESDSAAWTAIILHERYKCPHITILTNGKENTFKESSQKLLDLYHIDINKHEIRQILGDLRKGSLEGFVLSCGTHVPAEICFISLGMIVYNELAKSLGANLDERGFVEASSVGETNVENLFVAGDLKANTRKQVYTAWDTAVDAADEVNKRLRSLKRNQLLKK